jgi:hypothetical protein
LPCPACRSTRRLAFEAQRVSTLCRGMPAAKQHCSAASIPSGWSVYTGQCGEVGWLLTSEGSILFSFETDFAGG